MSNARVLLDTNIIIYRENKKVTNYSVGHLFRWMDKLRCDKIIHPYSIQEIEKYNYADPREAITLKLDAYNVLKTVAPIDETVNNLMSSCSDNNDRIDLYLLNEVYSNRVDMLITEDRKMRNKAYELGIGNKILSINAFISFATAQNPELVEYKALAVKKEFFGNIDLNNSFFDSFRVDYQGFNNWFARKCDEEAYICQNDAGELLGFLYLKSEDESESYLDISPIFQPEKRLKVGTFKVESTGYRSGERFIKIILDNAIEQNVDEIYITLFEDRQELQALADLLFRWGFIHHGTKSGNGRNETVLVKQMKLYNPLLSAREKFPNLLYTNKQKFIMPILPQYHTTLFPDSILKTENEVEFLGREPHQYALQKVYISWANTNNAQSGDIVLFYRMAYLNEIKKYKSVLTTVGVVDEIISNFSTYDDFLNHCQNRSVFSDTELNEFWNKNRYNLKILKFVFVKSLTEKVILGDLRDMGIIGADSGPRPFTLLADLQFKNILCKSKTDLHRYWRTSV